MEDREGYYGEWKWSASRKCWERFTPHRIYPQADGTFATSSADCWHEGVFATFEEAERDAVES